MQAGIPFAATPLLPIRYRHIELDAAYRPDLIVADQVLLELKAIDALAPIHEAQLLTYLRLSRIPVGLLINFNTLSLIEGIRRRVLGGATLACVAAGAGLRALDSAAELPSSPIPGSVPRPEA